MAVRSFGLPVVSALKPKKFGDVFFFFATSSSIIAFAENAWSAFRTPVQTYRQLLLDGLAMVSAQP